MRNHSSYSKELEVASKGKYAPIQEYAGAHAKIKHKCVKHNTKWIATPISLLSRGSVYCQECVRVKRSRSYKCSLGSKFPHIKVVGKYVDFRTPVRHKCTTHGKIFSLSPNAIINGTSAAPGCYKCSSEIRSAASTCSREEYVKRLASRHAHITLTGKFHGIEQKAVHRCSVHDYTWKVDCGNLLRKQKGCPMCKLDAIQYNTTGFKWKEYKLGSRTVRVQGYEPQALDYILSKGYDPDDIVVSSERAVPVIAYRGAKRHYPDLYIKSKRMIVEVKSDYTFGLSPKGSNFFYQNADKIKAAKAAGYRYVFLVFDGTNRVPLPKRWYNMSHKKILASSEIQAYYDAAGVRPPPAIEKILNHNRSIQ